MRVDDRISDSEAACLQSLSDSVAAVETAGIGIGDSVAIFGQGSMGLECLKSPGTAGGIDHHGGRARGVVPVISGAWRRGRRERRADDPVAAIRDLTGGNGADVVFECAAGVPSRDSRGPSR